MPDASQAPTEQVESQLAWRPAAVPIGVVVTAGFVVASAVLPWYATQIGPADAESTIGGLESGGFAVMAVALAAFVVVAGAALALDAAGAIELEPPIAVLVAWTAVAASAAACALAAYRLVFIPEPSEFLTRDIGVWLAFLGSAGAAALSAAQIPGRVRAARSG